MMPHLVIQCRFVAHSYSGVRLTEDRREELDWPPSPGRLHQALMSAALAGLPRGAAEAEAPMAALRWLERQPPPFICASELAENARTRHRVAIPQNNPKGPDLASKSLLLAPTVCAIPARSADVEVHYQWPLTNEAEARQHLPVLADAAARLVYFGRAEDRVEATSRIETEIGPTDLVRWQPSSGAPARLWLAREGTSDALERRYRTPVAPRERKPPAQRWMIAQPYARICPQPRSPVQVMIFQVFPANDDPDAIALSCDPESSGQWRAALRGQIVKITRETSLWDDPNLATELLTGHVAGKEGRSEQPHLAIVPLPSFNATGTADGRVRRVALIGFARSEIGSRATEIYETLAAALDGENVGELSGRLRRCDVVRDKIWSQLIGPSRVWCSLTPVAIARGFKVPRFAPDGRSLASNERHRRKLAEWSALLRDSLRHIGLPEPLVRACSIELTVSPLLRRTVRAEHYRPPGESAALTHARIEFPEPVLGPLLVGDRRYQGLGIFSPA
jgi:CRISPR-associated protein Csb2